MGLLIYNESCFGALVTSVLKRVSLNFILFGVLPMIVVIDRSVEWISNDIKFENILWKWLRFMINYSDHRNVGSTFGNHSIWRDWGSRLLSLFCTLTLAEIGKGWNFWDCSMKGWNDLVWDHFWSIQYVSQISLFRSSISLLFSIKMAMSSI